MTVRHASSLRRQRGAVTLLIALVLLTALATIALYSTRTSVLEQRTANNDYRTKQAELAAQAGLDEAIAALDKIDVSNNSGGAASYTRSLPGRNLEYADVNGSIPNGSFTVQYTTLAGSNNDILTLTSIGRSADGMAQMTRAQEVGFATFLRYSPLANVTLKGALTTDNSFQLSNTATSVAVWAGSAVNGSPNTTNVSVPGVSILKNDPLLAAQMFFSNFFATTQENVQVLGAHVDCTNGCTANHAAVSAMAAKPGRLYWIDGNLNLNGNVTLGSVAAPIILIADGTKFQLSHNNATINGLVFLTNGWSAAGARGIVNGALIIDGDATIASGNLTVNFDTTAITNLSALVGAYLRKPGTWR